MKGDQMYGGDKPHLNLARLKMGGEKFELAVNPDAALSYRQGKTIDLKDVLHSNHIFSDAHKGLLASETLMHTVFKTTDNNEIIKTILTKGEIQLTAEHREKLRVQKWNYIITTIHRNAVDSRTGLPHPTTRVENALNEARFHIDDHKRAEDQIQDAVKAIRPILPIKFETREIEIRIPAKFAAKSYNTLKQQTMLRDEWQNDGSLLAVLEIPAGMTQDFFDELNKLTHGEVETKILKTK
jgi:ribosome maturation protein SDO1